MKIRKHRRAGATETVVVSLDPGTKRVLKKLAARKHQGNVSALITEMAEDAVRQAEFERAWAWSGGPELTDEARRTIDGELEEGWGSCTKVRRKGETPPEGGMTAQGLTFRHRDVDFARAAGATL